MLVKPAAGEPRFWVDGNGNGDQPYLVSDPEDRATVSWPKEQGAKASSKPPLEAHLAISPDEPRGRSGRFRLYLRLGAAAPPRPDHVVVLVDRSRSTTPSMHREAIAAVGGLFDSLPAGLTFDAISFARKARPLLPEGPAFRRSTTARPRDQVAAALDAGSREQGTNLAAALALAGQRIAVRGARRPLVLVITDGMLPSAPARTDRKGVCGQPRAAQGQRASRAAVRRRQADAHAHRHRRRAPDRRARRRPRRPHQPRQPRPSTAATGDPSFAHNLLRAPGVLRELDVTLPSQAVLEDSPPAGLVAGSVVVLAGSYHRGPPSVRVRGKLGKPARSCAHDQR